MGLDENYKYKEMRPTGVLCNRERLQKRQSRRMQKT